MRLGVGIGEATCAPAANSLIGDLFPNAQRAWALSVFMLGLPIGNALSYAIGGPVTQAYGWRTAFFVAGLPGLLCVLAVMWLHEPPRGMAEDHAVGARRRPGSPYAIVLSIPTMWWLIASGALHNFNMYAIAQFLSPFLIRFHGTNIKQAGLLSTAIYGLSGVVGLLAGGTLADAAYRRRKDGRLLVGAVAITIARRSCSSRSAVPPVTCWDSPLMGTGCGVIYAYSTSTRPSRTSSSRRCAARRWRGKLFAMPCSVSLGPVDRRCHRRRRPRAHAARLELLRAAGLHSAILIPAIFGMLAVVLFPRRGRSPTTSRSCGPGCARPVPRSRSTRRCRFESARGTRRSAYLSRRSTRRARRAAPHHR